MLFGVYFLSYLYCFKFSFAFVFVSCPHRCAEPGEGLLWPYTHCNSCLPCLSSFYNAQFSDRKQVTVLFIGETLLLTRELESRNSIWWQIISAGLSVFSFVGGDADETFSPFWSGRLDWMWAPAEDQVRYKNKWAVQLGLVCHPHTEESNFKHLEFHLYSWRWWGGEDETEIDLV